MRRTAPIIASVLLLASTQAFAHAHLDHANPAVGSTVATAPQQVTIWFTQSLEPKFSTIEVQDAKGAAVQEGAAALAPGSTTQLTVHLKPLPPGQYKVIWKAVSVDTHRSQGDFVFTVGQ
jgi:methionine-rich copper-binding protein CopC